MGGDGWGWLLTCFNLGGWEGGREEQREKGEGKREGREMVVFV